MKSNAADACVVKYIHYPPVILYMYVTLLMLYVCKQQTQTKQQIYTSKQTNIQNIMVVVGKIGIVYGISIFGQNIIKDLCNFLGWVTERWFSSIYILWVSLVILICSCHTYSQFYQLCQIVYVSIWYVLPIHSIFLKNALSDFWKKWHQNFSISRITEDEKNALII